MKFLLALVPMLLNHVVKRIFVALGLSIVTYVGFDIVMGQLKQYFINEFSAIPVGAIQLFNLAGGGVVLNILFGLLTFAVTFKTLSKLTFGNK